MKILFLSGWGSAVPLAANMEDSGHETRFWIEDKDSQDVGDGFVPKVDDYKGSVEWADMVICDDTHFGKINDAIREKGKPVVGGTKMTDALEEDRHLGQRLFKSVGLDVPESKSFKDFGEAIAYIKENPKPYVVKASGTAQNDKTTTYVGQADDGSDIAPVLEHMSKGMKGLDSVEIQERIDGLETAVCAFFNGKEFVGQPQINFEHKKLMAGVDAPGWGPQTGEMGTTALWIEKDNPLFKKLILPFQKPLAEMGYIGDFDVNCIVDKKGGIHPLEMTNRFGWPYLPLQVDALKNLDLAELFYDLASGRDADFFCPYPLSLCLVIGVPPLPYMNDEIMEKYSKDMPVLFKSGQAPMAFYPGEAKKEDDQWKVAGSSGCLGVVAHSGFSIEECRDECYSMNDDIIVPNKMVRNDIGNYTDDAIQALQKHGLISTLEPSRL